VLHANRSQNQRIEALAGFKSGKYEVMVATDIASRGIDVAGVSHVINYDVPENPEDYVHRIGRTGRAQAVGDAFTLVTPENADDIRAIERFIGQKIPELKLEDFPYQPFHMPRPQAPQGQGRGRPYGGQRHGGRPGGHSRGHGHSHARDGDNRGPASGGTERAPSSPRPSGGGQGGGHRPGGAGPGRDQHGGKVGFLFRGRRR
jgi:ATP-dependent RNA helicase RhlE